MITEDRIKHILGVARLMKKYARDFCQDEEKMFTLGLVHDIGYEFGGSEEHHILGYEILSKQGYEFAKEVLYHGKPTDEYFSLALDLLNFADLHINKKGDYVSFEDRLEDIKARRGESSPHYQNCKKVIDMLKEKGFGFEENEK